MTEPLDSLASQNANYRRGLVLGLTVAEAMILILFALLLALSILIARRNEEIQRIERSAEQARERLAALEEIVERSGGEEMLKSDVFTELVRVRAELDQARREAADAAALRERVSQLESVAKALDNASGTDAETIAELASAGEALKSNLPSEMSLEQAKALLPSALELADAVTKSDQSGQSATTAEKLDRLSNLAKENADITGRMANLQRRLENAGLGNELPPCWATEEGRVEYLFDIGLSGEGLVVKDYSGSNRLEDRDALPVPPALFDRPLSDNEFLSITRPLFESSEAKECRHFVRVYDLTGANQKQLYKNRLWTVEAHFYKYEMRNISLWGDG